VEWFERGETKGKEVNTFITIDTGAILSKFNL
jgi:hypothetical protein